MSLCMEKVFFVFINGERHGTIAAANWREAKRLARKRHGVSCDII